MRQLYDKEEGCIAFQTTPGKQMADFIEKIQNEVSDDVQIFSLSRPSAYREYEPYTFVHSYQEFELRAKQL
ncbi:DUF6718 family protein [Faecalicoccus acidiformans]|uniref:DUF6718 family protein n=1 Tax=Faecalicoccus acidiformans TaxID=915173 RepID=UPI003B59C8E4